MTKSLRRAPGNEELGELDHSGKDHKNKHDGNGLTVVGEAEGEPGNRENGEMLKTMSHAGCRPQIRRDKRQRGDDDQQEPAGYMSNFP
jgi:hypothetical protein